jgi:hypothetical protein
MFDQGILVLKPQPAGYYQAETPRFFRLKLLAFDAAGQASGQNRLDHKPLGLWSSIRCAGVLRTLEHDAARAQANSDVRPHVN